MLDMVAVRTQHNALSNFSPDRFDGKYAAYHISYVGCLLVIAFVVELKCTEVSESTTFTNQRLFIANHPRPQFSASLIVIDSLTVFAFKATIYLSFNDSTNLKRVFRLSLVTIPAHFHLHSLVGACSKLRRWKLSYGQFVCDEDFCSVIVIGASGFEPPASRSRTERSTRLSHAPTN
jgi:hypothetical protein